MSALHNLQQSTSSFKIAETSATVSASFLWSDQMETPSSQYLTATPLLSCVSESHNTQRLLVTSEVPFSTPNASFCFPWSCRKAYKHAIILTQNSTNQNQIKTTCTLPDVQQLSDVHNYLEVLAQFMNSWGRAVCGWESISDGDWKELFCPNWL